ncbi:MAG: PBP1A family penicillin-binding protein [Nitrospinae bacterium]|nr:PBP1A family penicillin-binding protein [Nitrospinota bacterium]
MTLKTSWIKKTFLFLTVFIFLAGVSGGVLTYLYYKERIEPELPDVKSLKNFKPSIISKLYDDKDNLVTNFYLEKRIWLKVEDIPAIVKEATIAVEDSNFYSHGGIDFLGIIRAAVTNFFAGSIVQGGSTITQQLSKTFFLSPERTIERKLKEVFISFAIEENFTKEEILELYLNQIYYGSGAYGIEAAADTYFGKHVSELNLAEVATLAAIPKAPSNYSPFRDYKRSKKRRAHVLKRMLDSGYIKIKQCEKYSKAKIKLVNLAKESNNAPYFVEHVRKDIAERLGTDKLYKDGLSIYTTLNRELQISARNALKRGLRELDKRIGYRGAKEIIDKWDEEPIEGEPKIVDATVISVEKEYAELKIYDEIPATLSLKESDWARHPNPNSHYLYSKLKDLRKALHPKDKILVSVVNDKVRPIEVKLEQEPEVEGAIISLDVKTGEVKAMVGGYDFNKSQFNRATQAQRQIGSAFKPIIYAAAIDKGFSPASVIIDAPIIINGWKPENYGKKFYGPTLLRKALQHSRNVVTVKLLQEIGIQTVHDFAMMLGIHTEIKNDLSIALGSTTLSLIDITNVYAIFARGGWSLKPIFIRYIKNRNGITIENNMMREKVLSIAPETAYIITTMLQSVVKHGTGRKVADLGHNIAGKTGTTNDYIDAWFIGYSPEIATGVWTGYDQLKPMGRGEAGSRAALPIWKEYMQQALKDVPDRNFPLAENLVFRNVDESTGLLAPYGSKNAYMEVFKKGTEPKKFTSSDLEETSGGIH